MFDPSPHDTDPTQAQRRCPSNRRTHRRNLCSIRRLTDTDATQESAVSTGPPTGLGSEHFPRRCTSDARRMTMTTLDDRLLPVFAAPALARQRSTTWSRRGGTREHGAGDRVAIRTLGSRPTSTCTGSSVCPRPGTPDCWHRSSRSAVEPSPSHFAAAALHGIPGFGRGAPRSRSRRGREHRRTAIRSTPAPTSTGAATVVVDGIPATDVAARSSTSAVRVGDASAAAGHRVGVAASDGPTGRR